MLAEAGAKFDPTEAKLVVSPKGSAALAPFITGELLAALKMETAPDTPVNVGVLVSKSYTVGVPLKAWLQTSPLLGAIVPPAVTEITPAFAAADIKRPALAMNAVNKLVCFISETP